MPKLIYTIVIAVIMIARPIAAAGGNQSSSSGIERATDMVWSGTKQAFFAPEFRLHWAVTLLGALAVSPLDDWATTTDVRKSIMPNFQAKVGDKWGAPIAASIILPSVYLADKMLGVNGGDARARLEYTFASLTMVGIITVGMKAAAGRERPNGRGNLSFPSGHSSISFGVAEVVRVLYGNKTSVPFYLLAVNTALSRIHDNKHHPSDVVAGAGLGIGIVRGFTISSQSELGLSAAISPGRDGVLVSFSIALD